MLRHRLPVAAVLLGTAALTAVAVAWIRPSGADAETAAAVDRVRRIGDELAAGRYEAVWDALAAGSRERLGQSHVALVQAVRRMSEHLADPASATDARRMLGLLEEEHGLSRERLLASTPRSMWAHALERVLGPEAKHRAFGSMEVVRVLLDQQRAVVDVRLADGRTQSFPLTRTTPTDAWSLADFVPYCPSHGYLTVPVAVGPAAPATGAGTAPVAGGAAAGGEPLEPRPAVPETPR